MYGHNRGTGRVSIAHGHNTSEVRARLPNCWMISLMNTKMITFTNNLVTVRTLKSQSRNLKRIRKQIKRENYSTNETEEGTKYSNRGDKANAERAAAEQVKEKRAATEQTTTE